MQWVDIRNKTNPLSKPIRAGYCSSFSSRLRGFMFYPTINPNEALLLVEKHESRMDTAVHMFFMAFDLGVIWLDAQGAVVDLRHARRWHPIYTPSKPAQYVLEVHPSRLSDFHLGDSVVFTHA